MDIIQDNDRDIPKISQQKTITRKLAEVRKNYRTRPKSTRTR
jgi:hypothetical protein